MRTSNFITCEMMNSLTETILEKAGISTVWQGSVKKINIDSIIEFEYDLDIQWENIDLYSPGNIVLAAIFPKQKIIYMNETKRELFVEKMGTMNFSKAHELGHWVLHVTDQKDYEQLAFSEFETFYCRSYAKKPPQETQADMFAASILMPKSILSGAIHMLKKHGRVTFNELYKLKDAFEVSISALTIRIQELKLLYFAGKNIYFSEAEATGQLSLL